MNIPLCKPFLGNEEMKAVERVLSSRRLAVGDTVKELEEALAEKFRRKYCIAVSSGTTALYLGLKALGVERVIIPSITCEAVLHAVLNSGAGVIFADVEPETHNLDLSNLSEAQLSSAGAVIVTHSYGHSMNMDNLNYYTKKHNLVLVEDFAQAIGGYFRDRILGSFGKIAITSFYATKGMTTGHGGAIFTDDESLYRRCVHGRGSRMTNYYEDLIPMNFQMTDIQAAIGIVQLKKLDIMNEMRRCAAAKYTQELKSSRIELLYEKAWAKHTYYKYVIMLPDVIRKLEFIDGMNRFGIEVGKMYDPPLHQTMRAAAMITERFRLPVSEDIASKMISLPIFPELSRTDIENICKAAESVINRLIGKTLTSPVHGVRKVSGRRESP